MHWILLALAAAAFGMAFFAPSQAMIGVGMVIGLILLFAGFFAMIAARIASRARSDSVMLTDADVNALRKSVREAREAARKPPGAGNNR